MDGPLHGDVSRVRCALECLGKLVAGLLGEGHDVHDVLVSTLRYFLYDLSVTNKKCDVAQGC